VIRPLRALLLGCLVFWAVAAGLIYLYWDRLGLAETAFPRDVAILFHSAALGLCLVPMAVTLLWVGRVSHGRPDQQLTAVLGGTGVRMFFVLGAGLILTHTVPVFKEYDMTFWLWVLAVYLVTLALEIALLVRHREALEKQQHEEAVR
jgi:hypothetical protein